MSEMGPQRLVVGCCAILALQLLGEVVSRGLSLPVPGPVIGMALLLVGMRLSSMLQHVIRPIARVLLGNLSLLFVPAGVGIVAQMPVLRSEGLGLAIALVVSTAAAVAVGAVVFVSVAHLLERKR